MWTPQARQRPRSTAYETSGTLSYHAISCPQAMQADAGLTSDRLQRHARGDDVQEGAERESGGKGECGEAHMCPIGGRDATS